MDQDNAALGILETTGWTPALDAMEKSARIELWQAELNDFLGTCLKITGPIDAVSAAIAQGADIARTMGGDPRVTVIPRASAEGLRGIDSRPEFNPLIQQDVLKQPTPASEAPAMNANTIQALGFIETQGFTAVFEAIDTACKSAQVEVVGKEKLGGGYVTIVIRGDVAAVRAAIDAATPKVQGLGTLIAAHVIPRPSPAVLGLLPG